MPKIVSHRVGLLQPKSLGFTEKPKGLAAVFLALPTASEALGHTMRASARPTCGYFTAQDAQGPYPRPKTECHLRLGSILTSGSPLRCTHEATILEQVGRALGVRSALPPMRSEPAFFWRCSCSRRMLLLFWQPNLDSGLSSSCKLWALSLGKSRRSRSELLMVLQQEVTSILSSAAR